MGSGGVDLDLSEEAQMMQAIAMSLGENVVMTTDQVCCLFYSNFPRFSDRWLWPKLKTQIRLPGAV